MATRTIKTTGGNSNATGTYVEGLVPTSSDDVVFASGFSGTFTVVENMTVNSFDAKGVTGGKINQKTFAIATVGKNAEGYSFRLVEAIERESGEGGAEVRLRGTSTETGLVDFGGHTMDNIGQGSATETMPHQLARSLTSQFTFNHTAGTLIIGAFTLRCRNFACNSTNTRKLVGEAGGKLEGTSPGSGAINFEVTTGLTLELAAAFTMIVTDGHESKESFKGGGLNFKCMVEFTATAEGVGPGITGSNTWTGGLSRPVAGATKPKLVFFASNSQFFATAAISGGLIRLSGESGNKLEILSSTSGTQATIEATRKFEQDYVELKDLLHKGNEGVFYWGAHSSIISNVDGAILAAFSSTRTNTNPLKHGAITGTNMSESDYDVLRKRFAPHGMDRMMLYDGWAAAFLFKGNREESLKFGMPPIIGWSITKEVQGTKNDGTLGNVATGVLDTYLEESITSAKLAEAAGVTLYVRLCHEFNGNWDSYGANKETAAKFIEGWRYVVNKFKEHGVTNIKWCWGPNIWHIAHNTTIVNPAEFYPGDEYVDYVGLDGYMNLPQPTVHVPAKLFLQNYLELREIAPTKPVVIFEVGCAKDARVTRHIWVKEFFELVRDQMPAVIGVNWWMRHDAEGSEGDYTLDGSGATGLVTDAEAIAEYLKNINEVPFEKTGELKFGTMHIKGASGTIP